MHTYMALSSALAQEGVSRVSSYISSKLDDKASRAQCMARLEMALSRLEFVLERTGKMPITYVSLLRRWKMLQRAYIEGTCLLSKHKQLQVLEEGHTNHKVVVTSSSSSSSSCLQRISNTAANLSVVSSMLGLNKVKHLSSSIAQTFEWYADCADKFVADVESVCPLRCNAFRYPFVRQLFEGKTLWYQRMEGSQRLRFHIWPMILAGCGVKAYLRYECVDQERLDRCVSVDLVLRLSESTDIVGAAVKCLQSSMSLLNLVIQDNAAAAAAGELTLLHSLQGVVSSSSHSPESPVEVATQEWTARRDQIYRSDTLCCQPNGLDPAGVDCIIPSEISHILPEETIYFGFQCYIPPAIDQYSRRPDARSSSFGEAISSRNNVRRIHRPLLPLSLAALFIPLHEFTFRPDECFMYWWVMGSEMERAYGTIQQTVGTVRSHAIDYLARQPEATDSTVAWFSKHSSAHFRVCKASNNSDMSSAPKTRGGCTAKRKR